MRLSRDRRGQSVVVGTVILFGFLIVALSLYQVQVVPQENTNVEFEHSQQVEGEFLDLRNAVLSASRTGDGRSTSLKLGTRYPQRTFTLNPPPASGRLSTTEPRELRIENVTVEGDKNVVRYWTNRTSADGAITFDTRSLRYSPDYNEFRNEADLVYEHSLVVAEFDSTALGRTGQTVVDEDRLRLTALDGNVDTSGVERTTLDPEALSQSRRTVRLSSTGGDPIVLELPTDVSMDQAESLEQQWRDRLGEDAETVTVAGGTVRIELNGTPSYRLELGKVGLGTDTSAPNESTGYIKKVSSNGGVAVAEVRDRFNNPVAGANVTIDNGTQRTVRTDGEGRIEYTATNPPEDVKFEINGNVSTWEFVRFENLGTTGGIRGVIGGNRTFNVTWLNEEPVTVVEGGEPVELNVSVTNRDGNRIRNSTIDYSFSPRQGGGLPSLSPESSEQNSGRDTVNFDPGRSNAADEFDVYASAGDDVDRIEVAVIGGTVDLQDEIFESDSEFTVDHGLTNLNSGYLVVENAGDTFEDTVGDGSTTVDAADVGGINDGDTISATLYQDDSLTTELATDTETVGTVSPTFSVDITSTNAPVTEGENLNVEVTVENTGGAAGTQNIRFLVDGQEINVREVTLAGGAQTTESFTYQSEQGDSPDVDVRVESDDDFDTRTATVNAPAQFDVGITSTNEPITEGEDLNVDYTVENTGDETDTQTIELLDFDDQVVDSIEVTLDGGETTSGTLTWSTAVGDAESDDVTVRSDDDTATQTVTIEPTMASLVSTTGSPSGSNIRGGPGGGGSRIGFDVTADSEVTLSGFSVTTDIGTFTNDGSTVGGDEPSTTFSGQVSIDLVRFSQNNIQNSIDEQFVDPDTGNPDIVVTLQFDDGSVLEIGIT